MRDLRMYQEGVMEREVTQLHRLTKTEIDVVTLFRTLNEKQQQFILMMLESQADQIKPHQDNVVRFNIR